jgi:hypothetical protein
MKYLFSSLLVLVVAITSSCTREYTCQCTVKYYGKPPGIADSVVHEFAVRDTKKEASKKCEANSVTTSQDNVTMEEKCRLY